MKIQDQIFEKKGLTMILMHKSTQQFGCIFFKIVVTCTYLRIC